MFSFDSPEYEEFLTKLVRRYEIQGAPDGHIRTPYNQLTSLLTSCRLSSGGRICRTGFASPVHMHRRHSRRASQQKEVSALWRLPSHGWRVPLLLSTLIGTDRYTFPFASGSGKRPAWMLHCTDGRISLGTANCASRLSRMFTSARLHKNVQNFNAPNAENKAKHRT